MMRSLRILPILLLSLAPGPAAAAGNEPGGRWLVGEVPDGVEVVTPEAHQQNGAAVVEAAFHGAGLCVRWPEWSDDGRSFVVAEPSDCGSSDHAFGTPESLKIVAYFPGYRVATFESEWRQIGSPTTWKIELERLAFAPVAGVVRDRDGTPLSGAEVDISYLLFELMAYFEYDDGSVPRLALARTTTGSAGELEAAIPRLTEDPFFNPDLKMVEIWVGGRPTKRLSLNQLFAGRIEVWDPP